MRWGALLGLTVAAALGGLAQSLAGAAGALLADGLGGTSMAGLPQAVLVVGQAAAALLLSRLTARTGRRRALATGAVTAVGGATIVAVAAVIGSLALALAGNLLLGAGTAAVMLSRYAAADLAEPHERGRAMGRVLAATTVGAVAGPNLLAPSSHVAGTLGVPGLTGPYVVAGVTFAAAALVLWLGQEPPVTTPADAGRTDLPRPRWTRQALSGMAMLALANLVMVAVMTMAPVQLRQHGASLTGIGLVISMHIAGMFAPSPLSGRLVDRAGPSVSGVVAAVLLVAGCTTGASSMSAVSSAGMTVAMLLLGVGWNVSLLAGSALLTADVPAAARPAREGWGESGMGIAASSGGVLSGVVMAGGGYPVLALAGAVISAVVVPVALGARPSAASPDGAAAAAMTSGDASGAPALAPSSGERDDRLAS
jgi:MFS family permease